MLKRRDGTQDVYGLFHPWGNFKHKDNYLIADFSGLKMVLKQSFTQANRYLPKYAHSPSEQIRQRPEPEERHPNRRQADDDHRHGHGGVRLALGHAHAGQGADAADGQGGAEDAYYDWDHVNTSHEKPTYSRWILSSAARAFTRTSSSSS